MKKAIPQATSQATPQATSHATPEQPSAEDSIRILKVGSCPSLSGKSMLTYQIACSTESGTLVRISANTGGGFFNSHWISLERILEALKRAEKPFSAVVLKELFSGRSVNSAGFLLAVLRHLGLVQPLEDKEGYEALDPAPFLATVKALIASPALCASPEDLATTPEAAPEIAGKKPSARGKSKA